MKTIAKSSRITMLTSIANQKTSNLLWAYACQCIETKKWEEAEGLLLRIWQINSEASWLLRDALGYSLLRQGEYVLCEQILRPALKAKERSYWVSHKIADALRGQGYIEEAAEMYKQSESEGSDSPITAKNLIQVLYKLNASRAIEQLNTWKAKETTPIEFWQGSCEASILVGGNEIAEWLWENGFSDHQCREKLIKFYCYKLEIHKCLEIIDSSQNPSELEIKLKKKLINMGIISKDGIPSVEK